MVQWWAIVELLMHLAAARRTCGAAEVAVSEATSIVSLGVINAFGRR